MTFLERMKELRAGKKMSQGEIARDIGVAQSTVGGWEAGNREPNIDMLVRLSEYFGVTIDYLVGRADTKNGFKIKTPSELESVGAVGVVKTKDEPLTADEVSAIRRMLGEQQNRS